MYNHSSSSSSSSSRSLSGQEVDVYVIGVQECGFLEELREAVSDVVGRSGRDEYEVYTNSVWSPLGHIALLVYVKRELLEKGGFKLLGNLSNRVYLGEQVMGLGHLPNKAAVGLACRIYDRSMAFVTAHLAADKHGKERVEARLRVSEYEGEISE